MPIDETLSAMILRQHDGDMTEQQRLDRAIATAKREMNLWTAEWWRLTRTKQECEPNLEQEPA